MGTAGVLAELRQMRQQRRKKRLPLWQRKSRKIDEAALIRAPEQLEEILKLFRSPDQSGLINLSGLPLPKRQTFFSSLLPHLAQLRENTGRPHWLVIDSEKA